LFHAAFPDSILDIKMQRYIISHFVLIDRQLGRNDMKKFLGSFAVIGAFLASGLPASAHEAHVHGLARMNLAVDGQEVEIELDSPLANFVSFEHEPETDAQKQEVRRMAATLRKAEALFILPVEAKCRLEKVSLESGAISDDLLSPEKPGQAESKHERHDEHSHDGHGDIEAEISFVCLEPGKLNSMTVDLFRAFPDLHEVEVQMLTSGKQGAAELVPESNLLRW
jgi:hypothetical protein